MSLTQQTRARLNDLKSEYLKKQQTLLDLLPKEDREQIGFPIKEIDELTEFTAMGVRYIIRDSLTVTRFEEFEDLQSEVGYGVDFFNLFNNLSKSYTYLNNSKPADAAIVIYNLMHGIKGHLDDRINPILRLCALFISVEGEDLTKYDEKLTEKKIKDWRDEGIAMDNFFQLAFSLVNGYTPALKQVSQSILGEVETAKAKMVKPKKKR